MPDPTPVEEVQKLFLRNTGLLRGFLLGLVPDPASAEDLFQELFLTLTRKAEEFRRGTDFLAWARTVARFKVLEHHQRQKRTPQALDGATLEMLMVSAAAVDDTWPQRRDALKTCLQRVSPRSREILELRYGGGLAPGEIARKLAWSVGAIHVALARARKFLRDCARQRLVAKEA